jgi:hypothetical protein
MYSTYGILNGGFMELNIKINLNNDAYNDEDIGWELGKNLDYIISDIGLGLTRGKIKDSNGNTTGKWSLDDEDRQFIEDHFQFVHIGG